jgi:hypothetical protein
MWRESLRPAMPASPSQEGEVGDRPPAIDLSTTLARSTEEWKLREEHIAIDTEQGAADSEHETQHEHGS